jgi:DNA-binding transcriptional ArsR family regulator
MEQVSRNGVPTAVIVEPSPLEHSGEYAHQIPWERIARAEVHKLRLAILEFLAERPAASPKQLATNLKQPLASVCYHVKCLDEAGLVRLVRTEPRRGAVEHFYQLVDR